MLGRARRGLNELPWAVLRAGQAGGGRAAGVLSVWLAWERLMLWLLPVRPVRQGGLLLYATRRHRRKPLVLEDGTQVGRGARLVELHLDNRRLVELRRRPGWSAWAGVAELRVDLAELARKLESEEPRDAVAVHGTSLLGTAGPALGFETRELERGWVAALVRYFMVGADAVYHPAGLRRLDTRARERRPVEVWMSAARLKAAARRRG